MPCSLLHPPHCHNRCHLFFALVYSLNGHYHDSLVLADDIWSARRALPAYLYPYVRAEPQIAQFLLPEYEAVVSDVHPIWDRDRHPRPFRRSDLPWPVSFSSLVRLDSFRSCVMHGDLILYSYVVGRNNSIPRLCPLNFSDYALRSCVPSSFSHLSDFEVGQLYRYMLSVCSTPHRIFLLISFFAGGYLPAVDIPLSVVRL